MYFNDELPISYEWYFIIHNGNVHGIDLYMIYLKKDNIILKKRFFIIYNGNGHGID